MALFGLLGGSGQPARKIPGFEEGIFSVLNNITVGAAEGLSKGLAKLGDGFELPSISGSIAMVGDTVKTAMGSVFGNDSAPAAVVAKSAPVQEVAISAPAPQKNTQVLANVQEADRGDLGTMTPQTFSVAGASIGQSVGGRGQG